MGNAHPNSNGGGASGGGGSRGVPVEEALESMQKEKERNDHLSNLEFKRSKSIRRSIAKRMSKRRKKRQEQQLQQQLPDADNVDGASTASAAAASTSKEDAISTAAAAVVPPPTIVDDGKRKLTAKEPQPFPAHVQVSRGIQKAASHLVTRVSGTPFFA